MYKKQLVTAFFLMVFAGVGWGQTPVAGDAATLLNITRFIIESPNPLPEAQTQALLVPHLGSHSDLASIEAAAVTLERAIRADGHSFHWVIVPAQRPDSGVLTLRVLGFSLADVTVSGNRFFSSASILRTLPALRSGSSPNLEAIGRNITLANEHPAKRLNMQFRESTKPDHISAEVVVRDVPAAQTFIGLTGGGRDFDNNLNRNTGYTRLTVGHQRSNLFDRDHALTLAYTTSPDHLSKVSQYGVFYWMPLYGYHTSVSAYWTKSDIDTGNVGVGGVNFAVSGKGEFYGLRASYALPKTRLVAHSVSLAVDARYFESSVGFAGGVLPTTAVGSMPATLRYSARSDQLWGGIGGNIEYVHNLGSGRGNDALAYTIVRATAGTNWNVIRWEADAQYNFASRWSVSTKLRGQYADDVLIPGEQFGVGGVASVRGLREREATGDRGYTANFELVAPAVYAGVVPFAFSDFGRRIHLAPVPGVAQKDNVASVGLGARWNWEKGLDISVSYANVLNGVAGGTPRGHDKVNFSLFYRF